MIIGPEVFWEIEIESTVLPHSLTLQAITTLGVSDNGRTFTQCFHWQSLCVILKELYWWSSSDLVSWSLRLSLVRWPLLVYSDKVKIIIKIWDVILSCYLSLERHQRLAPTLTGYGVWGPHSWSRPSLYYNRYRFIFTTRSRYLL